MKSTIHEFRIKKYASMSKKIFLLLAITFFSSCSKDENSSSNTNEFLKRQSIRNNYLAPPVPNTVLLLKVDYLTHTFEGGKEFTFPNQTNTFTIQTQYQAPSDFGGIKLYYQELNQQLFNGSIHWMGTGSILFPSDFQPAGAFAVVQTLVPVAFPTSGFQNVFNPDNTVYNYQDVWSSIAYLQKTGDYGYWQTNTIAPKIFLYTPSVGIGDPATWKWIVILKRQL
jgi:hypothetical protein